MLLLIVVGKFLVWAVVVWLFRYSFRTAMAVPAGLTQIGELSFVVVQVARSSGLVSILLNVFVVRAVFRWSEPETSIAGQQVDNSDRDKVSGL